MNSRNRKALEVRAMEEQRKSSSSGFQDGIAAQLGRAALGEERQPEPYAKNAREFLELVASTDWTDMEFDYCATNVLYARGSLGKETRREAVQAIRTLQAIIRDARALRGGRPTQRSTTGDDAGPGIDK